MKKPPRKEDVQVIDTTVESLITDERLAKGDLRTVVNGKGFIKTAEPNERYIIEKLVRDEKLDYYHAIYGVGFLELRAAFRSPWATKISAVLLEQFGVGISLSRATELYQNVCRGMLGRGLEVVQFAMEMGTTHISSYSIQLYQEHFQRLVDLMDEERRRIYDEEQAKAQALIDKK